MNLAGVADPRHTEDDLPFGLAQAGDDRGVGVVRVFVDDGGEAVEHLGDGLMELGLARIALKYLLVQILEFRVHR